MEAHSTVDRIVKETRGKYRLWDSGTDRFYDVDQGLAFALGVAVMEAELVRDITRFWSVQHPNGTNLYHVAYMPSGQVITTKVC